MSGNDITDFLLRMCLKSLCIVESYYGSIDGAHDVMTVFRNAPVI